MPVTAAIHRSNSNNSVNSAGSTPPPQGDSEISVAAATLNSSTDSTPSPKPKPTVTEDLLAQLLENQADLDNEDYWEALLEAQGDKEGDPVVNLLSELSKRDTKITDSARDALDRVLGRAIDHVGPNAGLILAGIQVAKPLLAQLGSLIANQLPDEAPAAGETAAGVAAPAQKTTWTKVKKVGGKIFGCLLFCLKTADDVHRRRVAEEAATSRA